MINLVIFSPALWVTIHTHRPPWWPAPFLCMPGIVTPGAKGSQVRHIKRKGRVLLPGLDVINPGRSFGTHVSPTVGASEFVPDKASMPCPVPFFAVVEGVIWHGSPNHCIRVKSSFTAISARKHGHDCCHQGVNSLCGFRFV